MGEYLISVDLEGKRFLLRRDRIPLKKTNQEFPSGTREEFIENCKAGKYDDVVALYRSNNSTKVGINFTP